MHAQGNGVKSIDPGSIHHALCKLWRIMFWHHAHLPSISKLVGIGFPTNRNSLLMVRV